MKIHHLTGVTGWDAFWWAVLPRERALRHLARRLAKADGFIGEVPPGAIIFTPPNSPDQFEVTHARGDFRPANVGPIPFV